MTVHVPGQRLDSCCAGPADRAVGARSEWPPGDLVGAFSGARVRDCSALTERDLNAVTERDADGGVGGVGDDLAVVVDRGGALDLGGRCARNQVVEVLYGAAALGLWPPCLSAVC